MLPACLGPESLPEVMGEVNHETSPVRVESVRLGGREQAARGQCSRGRALYLREGFSPGSVGQQL